MTLKYHLTKHQNKDISKTFKCNKCDKTFRLKGQLKQHEGQVHEEKKVSCAICNSSFFNQYNLERHSSAVHAKAKKEFAYYICGKLFKLLKYLETHKRRHYITFTCDNCEKPFRSKNELNNHKVSVHSSKSE